MTLNKRNLLKMQFLPLYIDYITFLSGEKMEHMHLPHIP